jgi:regulator of nucleoside diphosphate kinase
MHKPVAAIDWRVLTELDDARLRRLRSQYDLSPVLDEALDALLDQADLVLSREVLPEVVTMNSRVRVRSPETGAEHRLTICYPAQADVEQGRVSVLSPLGLALLGRSVGQQAPWIRPDGRSDSWLIEAIEYQPEANGEYTL